jgi:antitoxin YefM
MNAVNYSDLRRNLKSYMDKVYEEREPLIVTRRNNENVVVMSIDQYNSLVETSYLLGTEANARHLFESLRDARAGRTEERELVDE